MIRVILLWLVAATVSAEVPPDAARYQRDLTRAARFYFGLDAPIPALAGQIEQESSWNEQATSRAGARGLAQFMPATANDVSAKLGEEPQPYNAGWALRAQSRYMHDLYGTVKYAEACDSFGAALSAYNGGLGWHNKRRARAKDPSDFWHSVRLVNPGVSENSQEENENYSFVIVFYRQTHYLTWGSSICL